MYGIDSGDDFMGVSLSPNSQIVYIKITVFYMSIECFKNCP